MIAAGKKNRLKMKNNNQLCPLRLATRAGQNAMATQMITKMIKPNQLDPDIALTLLLVVAYLSLQRTRRTSVPHHPEWTNAVSSEPCSSPVRRRAMATGRRAAI